MNIRDLDHKQVCILGYGREGKAMASALAVHAPHCQLTIADRNADIAIERATYGKQLGEGWLENLDTFDLLIVSPGIPPSALPTTKTPQTNSTQIFLDSIHPQAVVVGVTGSKGKSTTASLVHHILKAADKKNILVGNIGTPAIANLAAVDEHTIVVLEMSSYQLMRTVKSPQIAVITSFFPEHLNYHGTLEHYKTAKKNITKFQTSKDTVYYYKHSEGAAEIAALSPGTKQPYDDSNSPVAIEETKLLGAHNLANIAGASAVAGHFGIADSVIAEAVRSFLPLAHRLQYVGTYSSIHWVDDAISTTPESAIAALHTLCPKVKTVILGGQDRGNDFTKLGEVLAAAGVEHAILMGESGPRISTAIKSESIKLHEASSMAQAVQTAKDCTQSTDQSIPICLLSPASPSYGMYESFEQKGQDFVEQIEKQPN